MTFLINFLGCKVNSYEVESIANDLIKEGFKNYDGKGKPDIVIVNTCSVTETSASKSRKMIRHYRAIYRKAIIVVMGCDVQNETDYYKDTLKCDIVLGTTERSKIKDYINDFVKNKEQIVVHENLKTIKKYEPLNVCHFLYNTRAYVKIQDGCDNYCTYCLIPYIRGHSRSRKEEEVLSEIKELIKNGYKEIVLTGIDMCSYGQDFKEKMTFSDLLEDILKSNPDLYRLRISSIEESQIDDHFINLLEKYQNIANHLHIPLQSGSVSILQKMNRKYDLKSYKEKIARIRKVRPNIAISTDVIVGFPTETDENFKETFDFCKEIHFSKIHVFPFSDRNGTIAEKMTPKVDPIDKKARVLSLISLSTEMGNEYADRFEGKKMEFLFENYDEKKKAYRGHSSNYLEIYYKSKENLTDKIKEVTYHKEFDNVKNILFDSIN
ncbi:MAG: tRNA (N(6)-L-threonylcarbamoyladenosine(37)-C(2))-methylthiotransferase MtaB [Bacilli bacterium]|jgi:threonylcarbamoyladenosine tRNA methylthiotransferase MtaB